MLYNESSYVIIGNGAAGFYAAEAIRKTDLKGNIHIISDENVNTYFRPQLSKFLGFPLDERKFYVAPKDWYAANNIQVTLNTKVKKINTENSLILIEDGGIIGYKKLILANGSHNFMPPLENINKENVFTLRNLHDAENIKKQIKKGKKAVIVGGGLLGLEAAWAMTNAGMDVTVLEHSSRLLSKQIDEEGSEMVMAAVARAGIKVLVNAQCEEIIGDEKATGLKLKTGEFLDADIILFSIGIRPNIDLPQQCGINTDKGVIVNERMETSTKNVYACGDIAEYNGRVFGNWPAAMNMGKVAGSNAAGDLNLFKEFVPSVFFDSIDVHLFSCGNNNEKSSFITMKDTNCYIKVYFDEEKITGGFIIGDTKLSSQILNAVKKGLNMDDTKKILKI